jgi:small-conductance mechanosensitive channel
MYALSPLGQLSLGLLAAGVTGVLFMLIYLRACAWADWDLMNSRVRRRVHGWERRAPSVVVGSSVLAAAGLLLGLVDGLT